MYSSLLKNNINKKIHIVTIFDPFKGIEYTINIKNWIHEKEIITTMEKYSGYTN
jgi:hypothetical protein